MKFFAENFKTYKHNPPHLFVPGAKYFITASAYRRLPAFQNDDVKEKMLEILIITCRLNNWRLEDWVFLNEHYHIMLQADEKGQNTVDKIINNFHKFSALYIKKQHQEYKKVKRIFYNYWDSCITYEGSYFARLHYIFINPVKHKYVKSAEDYRFGSYYHRVKFEEFKAIRFLSKYRSDKLDFEM